MTAPLTTDDRALTQRLDAQRAEIAEINARAARRRTEVRAAARKTLATLDARLSNRASRVHNRALLAEAAAMLGLMLREG